jgi:hypothetical protein
LSVWVIDSLQRRLRAKRWQIINTEGNCLGEPNRNKRSGWWQWRIRIYLKIVQFLFLT